VLKLLGSIALATSAVAVFCVVALTCHFVALCYVIGEAKDG
jgi:hypothetical protein